MGERKFNIYSRLFATAVVKNILLSSKLYKKFSPSQKFYLFPKLVHTPENSKIINKFINSAEDVINQNDQDEDAGHPKIEN